VTPRIGTHKEATMTRCNRSGTRSSLWLAVGIGVALEISGMTSALGAPAKSGLSHLSPLERLALIQRAQVWTPTEVASMNLRTGPQGRGAFTPDQTVSCDYVRDRLAGSTPKFACRLPDGDVVKVKYGAQNGEVEGEVLATRLLWALGFGADRMYPVRVVCRGCTEDPWRHREKSGESHLFDPAVIERKFEARTIESDGKKGWSWPELDAIDDRQGGATLAQRDALKLLAVFVQHTDSKPEQQRLVCLSKDKEAGGGCRQPFMLLNDVGRTFGQANVYNRNNPGSVSFNEWSTTTVWKEASGCVGRLRLSNTGTLENPSISEAGRAFLATRLVQLSDAQLRDLFDVARVERRSRRPGTAEPPASVEDWVAAFKRKRDEIVNRRCDVDPRASRRAS
jgi:hypothetical protein